MHRSQAGKDREDGMPRRKQFDWDITVTQARTDAGGQMYTALCIRKQDSQALSFTYLDEDEQLEGLKGKAITDKVIDLTTEQLKHVPFEDRKAKTLHTDSIRV
jgi:hypothetical protein